MSNPFGRMMAIGKPRCLALQSKRQGKMSKEISIAIETSCREGGVALGRGEELVGEVKFDAHGRAAAQLVTALDELLSGEGVRPGDVGEVYVSVGPGSFTGVRVGVTVARTLAQTVGGIQCVAVPTSLAVAERVAEVEWADLAVVLDAGDGRIYATRYTRRNGVIVRACEPAVAEPGEWLATAPRPILLTGEGLGYHELAGSGVEFTDAAIRQSNAKSVWRVGRRLARSGDFTEYNKLLPIYARPVEAVRLWQKRQSRR